MAVQELQRFAWRISTFGRWIGLGTYTFLCTTLLETRKFQGNRDSHTWQQVGYPSAMCPTFKLKRDIAHHCGSGTSSNLLSNQMYLSKLFNKRCLPKSSNLLTLPLPKYGGRTLLEINIHKKAYTHRTLLLCWCYLNRFTKWRYHIGHPCRILHGDYVQCVVIGYGTIFESFV